VTAAPRLLLRTPRPVRGPERIREADIPMLNTVFSDAFSDRYRRDGMSGVRVPPLNPGIWRYAIQGAGDGAMVWRDDHGQIVAFNIAHRSGVEGWMGPLCVAPPFQGGGLGTQVVKAGIGWLRRDGARVIGLETMPRTVDNIGFYSALGFVPGPLTITLTLDAAGDTGPLQLLSRLGSLERERAVAACRALTDRVMPGYDFAREMALTERLALGDTLLLGQVDAPLGFAICHSVSLVEGRGRDELRVLKLVLAESGHLPDLARALADFAKRAGTPRVAVRMQGAFTEAYRAFIDLGARVRWTDLRMSVHGWEERAPSQGLVLSNWEI
jgi:GNAT superfamily N-acetyltransferase